jgi:hypothetical protein
LRATTLASYDRQRQRTHKVVRWLIAVNRNGCLALKTRTPRSRRLLPLWRAMTRRGRSVCRGQVPRSPSADPDRGGLPSPVVEAATRTLLARPRWRRDQRGWGVGSRLDRPQRHAVPTERDQKHSCSGCWCNLHPHAYR